LSIVVECLISQDIHAGLSEFLLPERPIIFETVSIRRSADHELASSA
jgi:hypothetical protein